MDKLIIDPATIEALAGLDHGVQLCGPTGQSIGWFVPVAGSSEYDGYECPLSSEQLDRIEQQGGGRPLSDILSDLGRGT